MRRRAPGTGLAIGVALLAVDAALGLTLPAVVAFSDLLYAATLYGSRQPSRAIVPAAAVTTIGGLARAAIVPPDGRTAGASDVAAAPVVARPGRRAAD